MDTKTTKRILKQARLQQQQLENEFEEEDGVEGGKRIKKKSVRLGGPTDDGEEDDDEDEFALVGEEDCETVQSTFSKEIVRCFVVI